MSWGWDLLLQEGFGVRRPDVKLGQGTGQAGHGCLGERLGWAACVPTQPRATLPFSLLPPQGGLHPLPWRYVGGTAPSDRAVWGPVLADFSLFSLLGRLRRHAWSPKLSGPRPAGPSSTTKACELEWSRLARRRQEGAISGRAPGTLEERRHVFPPSRPGVN